MVSIKSQLISLCNLSTSDDEKSSYWSFYLKDYHCDESQIPFIPLIGQNSKRFLFSDEYHKFIQSISFSNLNTDFNSFWYTLALNIVKEQSRSLDYDMFKHVWTFEVLDKSLSFLESNIVCIIGDGQSNFASLALSCPSIQKVISVNLPEVLLNDWLLLENKIIDQQSSILCSTKTSIDEFIANPSLRFAMVQASDAYILSSQPINLFANICSMQEMSIESIEKYFDIIKSSTASKPYFYCCNRQTKVLPDSSVIEFSSYPWGNNYISIFYERCPWYSHYYSPVRFKFLPLPKFNIPFDGPIDHRLVQFN